MSTNPFPGRRRGRHEDESKRHEKREARAEERREERAEMRRPVLTLKHKRGRGK